MARKTSTRLHLKRGSCRRCGSDLTGRESCLCIGDQAITENIAGNANDAGSSIEPNKTIS